MADEKKKFVLDLKRPVTESPYVLWATQASEHFKQGYIACVDGVEYTPFQSTYWQRGYQAAVEIFGGPDGMKAFIEARGY